MNVVSGQSLYLDWLCLFHSGAGCTHCDISSRSPFKMSHARTKLGRIFPRGLSSTIVYISEVHMWRLWNRDSLFIRSVRCRAVASLFLLGPHCLSWHDRKWLCLASRYCRPKNKPTRAWRDWYQSLSKRRPGCQMFPLHHWISSRNMLLICHLQISLKPY